jgi:tetratricopeptide (TPR) repeat protein
MTTGPAGLLLSYGSALLQLGDDRAGDALSDARESLVALGYLNRAGRAESLLSAYWWYRGQRDRSSEHLDRALALVAERRPSLDKVLVLNRAASSLAIRAEVDAAIRYGEEALAMAEQLELDDQRILALSSLGTARSRLGDPQGVADMERALELAVAATAGGAMYNDLGFNAPDEGDVRGDGELRAEALRTARRFGDERSVRFFRRTWIGHEYFAGRWDDCVRHADEFVAECEAGSPHYLEADVCQRRAVVRLALDDVRSGATRRALELVREVKDPQLFHHVLSSNIRLNAELGRLDAARALADELLPTVGVGARLDGLIEFAWIADRIGMAARLRERFDEL